MRVLVVSPHFDDAPLSLGQSMVDGWLHAHRVTVGVVFGRSNWTRWFSPTPSRWLLATPIRLAEEVVNATRFRYKLRIAHAQEAILRTGSMDAAKFLDASFDARSDAALGSVRDIIAKWAQRADVVAVPLGLGDHIDHQLTTEIGTELLAAGTSVMFYEDRPYASTLSPEEIEKAAAAIDQRLVRRPVSGPMGSPKHRRIWYPSQFDGFFLDAIADDEARELREHVWVLPDSNLA